MDIQIIGNQVTVTGDRILAYALNHLVNTLTATTDSDPSWEFKLDVFITSLNRVNTISLERVGNQLSVDLTRDMLPAGGRYEAQFRMINGQQVNHTNKFDFWVESSLDPSDKITPIPTEYFQLEAKMESILEDCKAIYKEISQGSVGPVALHNESKDAHPTLEIDCGVI